MVNQGWEIAETLTPNRDVLIPSLVSHVTFLF